MNEKIKALLLNERNMFVNGVTESDNKIYIHGSEENLEKFAELIVRDLIDSMIKRYGDDDELPIQEIKLFVKEHFGVEE
jgi:hypothetical protein